MIEAAIPQRHQKQCFEPWKPKRSAVLLLLSRGLTRLELDQLLKRTQLSSKPSRRVWKMLVPRMELLEKSESPSAKPVVAPQSWQKSRGKAMPRWARLQELISFMHP